MSTSIIGLGLILALGVYTESPAVDEDAWFFRDFEAEIKAVNEGELRFLETPPARRVHFQENHLIIREPSLRDGWVDMVQCHENLDSVPRLEVVFNAERTRDLKVVIADDVERAWVEGASIQLRDVGRHARLCLSARSRALKDGGDGGYTLRNGPFMRRFLDGYYPMHVVMQVEYPCGLLDLVSASPDTQPGFRLEESDCGVGYDTWFEGRLRTELLFTRPTPR